MKNVFPIGKRDTTSFMDLTYMDHLLIRRLVNLPRVMLRHMAYVISVPSHELPYGDWLTRVFEAYHVPLDDKQGEEPKSYDFFEETLLTMCQLRRENGVWWLGTGEGRRRDDIEALAENVKENAEHQGEEQTEKEAEKGENSSSGEKFYDALSDEGHVEAPDVDVPTVKKVFAVLTTPAVQQTMKRTSTGVDPSGPLGSIPDFDLLHLQAVFDRLSRVIQDFRSCTSR
ncbi:hypothetical protein Dimus_022713 [Dionaea muscipula]